MRAKVYEDIFILNLQSKCLLGLREFLADTVVCWEVSYRCVGLSRRDGPGRYLLYSFLAVLLSSS